MVILSSVLKTISRVPLWLFALIMSAGIVFSAGAEPKPVVLIAGVQSAANGTIANEVYRAVINRLSKRISELGYGVVASGHEAKANASADAAAGDQILMQEAGNNSQNQVKFIAVIQVLALTSIETIGTRIHIRILGRIRDVSSGKLVETFVINSPDDLMAPPNCGLKCVITTLTDNAALLADQMSGALFEHLVPR